VQRWKAVRPGFLTAVALGLIGAVFTGSPLVGAATFVVGGLFVEAALAWVRRGAHPPLEVPTDALWSGDVTVRVADLLACPLLDTVTVKRPDRARRHPERGVPGDLVIGPDTLTWTANQAAGMAGVTGSVALPWTSVVSARAAVIPASTPGSGAIALTFADGSKLDLACAGNYRGLRSALTRLPGPLEGLVD
jgi:hypothetical protein